jgi:hypothetical protein
MDRKTPIGFLHRVLWIHIPHGLARLDLLLLGGRLVPSCQKFGRYIAYENHPLVLVSDFRQSLCLLFLISFLDLFCRAIVHIRIGVCAESMAEIRNNPPSVCFGSSHLAIHFSICVCHNQMFHYA